MTNQALGEKIEWEEIEAGYLVSMCGTFRLEQDQTYDIHHLYLEENDEHLGDGFLGDLKKAAQEMQNRRAAR